MTAISFENALGVHEMALHLRTKRSEVLANNLANADTPGFKARDFDFGQVLKQTMSISDGSKLSRTHVNHIPTGVIQKSLDISLAYRTPLQKSADGNTVDAQIESAQFAKNALEFGASFRFLNGKFSTLSKSITGK